MLNQEIVKSMQIGIQKYNEEPVLLIIIRKCKTNY